MILSFISALALSFVLTPLFEAISWQFKVLDYPNSDKVHSRPTPLLGGVAIYLSFTVIALLTLKEISGQYKALLISATIIFISGLVDDIKPFSALKRLAIQLIAASVLILGGVSFTFLSNDFTGKVGEVVLTLIWMVGITNAFNYMDGLNGLLSGAAIINAAFFFGFTYLTGQPVLGHMLMIFIGACMGFFPYNFFLGRIFLGNSGSSWIGFMLAGLAVIGDWAVDNPIDLVIPILIFGVPIFDMVTTTVMRTIDRKAKTVVELLEYRGKDHFHYKLSRAGLGDRGAVFFIYLICILLGLNALLLTRSSGDLVSAGIIFCASTLFFLLISVLMAGPYQKNS